MSEREFARATGRALSTVQEARHTGRLSRSIRKDKRGRIRIDPVLAAEEWLANTQQRLTQGAGGDTLLAWRAARARREAALASLAEDELRRTRGELVEAAGVQAAIVGLITRSKTKLLGVPSRVKQLLPHLAVGDIATIDSAIHEALEDLAAGDQGKAHGH